VKPLRHGVPPLCSTEHLTSRPAPDFQGFRHLLLLAKGTVTLLYAAHDESRNNAVALKAWLEKRQSPRRH
jgi:uncharacterized protein YeaO (DUF488 family)